LAKVRLDSWKSIAEYLKRSPRTVQRWHAEFGLPVHHFGGSRGPVFCYAEELDAWLSGLMKGEAAEKEGIDRVLASRETRSLELMAQADEMWEVRSEENLSAIAALYRGAIDQNPANALAFVGFANAMIFAAIQGGMRAGAAYPRAAEALRRAAHLGLEGPELRCATAWLQMMGEKKWRRAREGFEEALEAKPQWWHAMCGRGLLYVVEGNLAEGAACLKEAWSRNTFDSATCALLAWSHYLSGDTERALDVASEASAGGNAGSLNAIVEALALAASGGSAASLKKIEDLAAAFPASLVLEGVAGIASAGAGRAARARSIVANLQRAKGDVAYALALAFLGMDERHQAITCLESSLAECSLWSLGFRFDPLLEPLRGDRRFESMLRKLNPES